MTTSEATQPLTDDEAAAFVEKTATFAAELNPRERSTFQSIMKLASAAGEEDVQGYSMYAPGISAAQIAQRRALVGLITDVVVTIGKYTQQQPQKQKQ